MRCGHLCQGNRIGENLIQIEELVQTILGGWQGGGGLCLEKLAERRGAGHQRGKEGGRIPKREAKKNLGRKREV